MHQLQDPLVRTFEREEWGICEAPNCPMRVRFEFLCEEHREPGTSSVKYCVAEDCWDVLRAESPRRFCGLHEHPTTPDYELDWIQRGTFA